MRQVCSIGAFIVMLLVSECYSGEIPTGRLLVNIEPGATFSGKEFSQATSAHWVPTETQSPFGALQGLFLDHPFIVISSPLQGAELRRLAMRHGYHYVTFTNEPLAEAVEQTLALLANVPKYTSELPHRSEEETTRIYSLLEKIDKVFTQHNIRYWAGRSLLLGAVRYSGLVPWDNDLSLYILDEDESKLNEIREELAKAGVGIHDYFKDLYKLYDADGWEINDASKPDETLAFRYPTVDLFVMTLEKRWTIQNEPEEFYVHRSYDFYWWWGHDRFTSSQIQLISRIPFCSLSLPIPGDPESYLNRLFGTIRYPDLWKRYTLEPVWDHKLEQWPSTPGTALVEIDEY